jgi:hypothetical protein
VEEIRRNVPMFSVELIKNKKKKKKKSKQNGVLKAEIGT